MRAQASRSYQVWLDKSEQFKSANDAGREFFVRIVIWHPSNDYVSASGTGIGPKGTLLIDRAGRIKLDDLPSSVLIMLLKCAVRDGVVTS